VVALRHLAMTAAALTVAVVSLPQRASAAPACVPSGADVVTQSGPLAVYSGSDKRLIACRDGASGVRRRTVGYTSFCEDGADCEADRVLAVTGSCVAVQSYRTDRYHNDSWSLVVWDVRQTRGWSYGLRFTPPSSPPPDLDTVHPIPAVTVGPGCAIAYINTLGAGQPAEVRTADCHGRRLQARSVDIDPASLRRSGSTITWTEAGAIRTAPLAGAPSWRRPRSR
jgi:hypothetical protein